MTTAEKLFVQVFERKNWIIDQVKQQTELYSQHLASKLLIDGITPPAWFWSPNSSHSKELNKEELISKLLRPYPQPSVHCSVAPHSLCSDVLVAGNNEELSGGYFMENLTSDRGFDRREDPTVSAMCSKSHVRCEPSSAPEEDVDVTSPKDQTDERIVNIINAPDQSLARFQRSKSRQKALELRSSAKSQAKCSSAHEGIKDFFSGQIRLSLSASKQVGQEGELPKLAEPSVSGGQNRDYLDVEARNQIQETITRSRNVEVPVLVEDSSNFVQLSERCRDVVPPHLSKPNKRGSVLASNSVEGDATKLLKYSSAVSTQVSESLKLDVVEAHENNREKKMEVCTGRITRSRSARDPALVESSRKLGELAKRCGEDIPSHHSKARKMGSVAGSQSCEGQKLDFVEAHGESKGKDFYIGRITRSRSATVPVLVEGSSKVGQSSARCREDNFPHVSTSGKTGSVLIFYTDQDDPSKSQRSTSAVWSPSCKAQKSGGVDCLYKHNKSDVCAAQVSKEKFTGQSHSFFLDSLIADSDNQSIRGNTMDNKDDIPHYCDAGSLLSVDPNVISESCRGNGGNDAIVSGTLAQYIDHVNMTSDLVIPSSSAKADGRIRVESSRRSERLGVVIPSVVVVNRVITSPILCNDRETSSPINISENHSFGGSPRSSSCEQKSAANIELQNALTGQTVPSCDETHHVLDEQGNSEFVMATVLSSHDHVDKPGSSSSSGAKRTRKSESIEGYPPSDSTSFVEPKQLYFDEIEEYNLRTFSSNSGKGSLDKSAGKMNDSSLNPSISLDKGTSGRDDHLSLDKLTAERSEISSKWEVFQRDSFEAADTFEDPGSSAQEHGLVKSKRSGIDPDAGKLSGNSEIQNEEDILQEELVDVHDFQIQPVKHHEEQIDESSHEAKIDKGVRNQENKAMSPLTLHVPESKTFSPSDSLNLVTEPTAKPLDCSIVQANMESPPSIVLAKLKQLTSEEFQASSCLQNEFVCQDVCSPAPDSECLPLVRFRSANLESWPQLKRRKIDHEQTNSPTTFPSFRVREPQNIQGAPVGANLKHRETEDTVLMDMSYDMEILQQMDNNLTEGIESNSGAQTKEDQICHKQQNEHKESSSLIDIQQLGVSPCLSLTKTKPFNNLQKITDSPNSEYFTFSGGILQRGKSPQWESSVQPQQHVLSSINMDTKYIDVDQTMPVFEGFTIDPQAETSGLEFAADGINLDKLALPSSTLERASILAEICRSASMDTPLSHFSSVFEFQENQSSFQSVPNGLLEHLNLRSTLPSGCSVDNQLQSGNEEKGTFEQISYSDYGSYPGSEYGWSSRNQLPSPVGKLWERLSSHTGSSEKSLSSNPELTCFPIEEDPGTSEETRPDDESTDNVPEEINSSLANHSNEKQPLTDLTNWDLNTSVSVSDKIEILDVDDLVRGKFCDTGTQDKVQWSPKYQFRNSTVRREKQTSSMGATTEKKNQKLSMGLNGFKNGKESITNSLNRTMLSGKTLRRQDRQPSSKESRTNNIVSNVSSFIPLVQQRQSAAACAGKRDVKVKALEAAEAAKRLEEKRENERKMRKEALKLERAKLEEKNIKQMELEKKKKEEERKKKEADIVARKRLREEEERKEKEKKRMKLEARHRQREQEGKMRAEKAEKEKQRSKDEQMNHKKDLHKESKLNNGETVRGEMLTSKETETRLTSTVFAKNNEECSTSVQDCEAGRVMEMVDKSPTSENLIVRKGKSYEISPYQSDDDDEESDGPRAKKYIPPWASKISVAQFLALQQEADPNVIFPPESSRSMDEGDFPRTNKSASSFTRIVNQSACMCSS